MPAKKQTPPPPAPLSPNALLTIKELSRELRLPVRVLEGLKARRAIPHIAINARNHRYKLAAVQAALEKLTVRSL